MQNDSIKIWDEALNTLQKDILNNIDYLISYPLLEEYLEYIILKQGQRLLEPGAGSGLDSLIYAKKFGIRPYLLDFSGSSREMTIKLSQVLEVPYNFIFGDCRMLPFEDNTFDLVWNNGVNEHFTGADRQDVFNEMSRVCKRNGYVLVIVPNAWNPFYRLKKKILDSKNKWPFGFEKPFSPYELKERIRNSGLEIIKYGAFGILSSISDFIKLLNSFLMNKTGYPSTISRITKDSFFVGIARKINRSSRFNCFIGSLLLIIGRKK